MVHFPDGTQDTINAMASERVRMLVDPRTCKGWSAEPFSGRGAPRLSVEEVVYKREQDNAFKLLAALCSIVIGCIPLAAWCIEHRQKSLAWPQQDA